MQTQILILILLIFNESSIQNDEFIQTHGLELEIHLTQMNIEH